ncbi:MAG: hypothetical protein A3I09_02490 [Deltaproteobacteria bacterium RIFCSPLOWO2_02_FULL_47_10]|nr:MAG: hypothetical protein A3I09_02490 [Deltaproteobacteria bacterium RIFCSPLOWO2_02_FULL_47_10]
MNGIIADIGRAQTKGDKTLAKVLLEDYPSKAPGLLEALAKKFAAAGIPRDVALVYHVTGM